MPPARLAYRETPALPRLAWVASADPESAVVTVYHGSAVECRPEWMVEGVWDGPFAAGAFHTSEHFFGSGIRVADGRVYFVPSSALVGRLLAGTERGRTLVSNSLVALLAFTGARLDPDHDYHAETYAIRRGPQEYPRGFPVVHGEIRAFEQVYGDCLVWEGGGGTARASLRPTRPVPSYQTYRTLVAGALRELQANLQARERRLPCVALATISAGYDSAASAALVRNLGVETCFTAPRSNTHWPEWLRPSAARDDGKPIADRLGLATTYLEPPSAISEDELYFLAPGCAPTTVALHSLARYVERRGRLGVVFTGFLGDEVWERSGSDAAYQRAGVVRGDTTALMLTEIRLKSGFVNVAVPSLFARSAADLAAVAASPDMWPWRLGGAYDRPIPRRILEEAGVPRALFGTCKRAVVTTAAYPFNPALRRRFFAYVQRVTGRSAAFVYLHSTANRALFPLVRGFHLVRRRLTGAAPPRTPAAFVGRRYRFPYLGFAWAAETLARELAPAFRDRDVAPAPAGARRPSPPAPQARAIAAD